MPNLRLIPVVIFAATCLLVLKTVGFMADVPAGERQAQNGSSEIWKKLAGGDGSFDPVVTGSTPEAKGKAAPMAALPKDGASEGAAAVKGQANEGSASERALIERLQERRQELEARARDLEMRESLLKAAEKQLDSRLGEIKGAEAGETEASERIKSLVIMYEAMGPKEAARIFDRLDPRTLVELVNAMNPRKVSEIMARMQPEAAERMTIELARGRSAVDRGLPATDLRRIDAKNTR